MCQIYMCFLRFAISVNLSTVHPFHPHVLPFHLQSILTPAQDDDISILNPDKYKTLISSAVSETEKATTNSHAKMWVNVRSAVNIT